MFLGVDYRWWDRVSLSRPLGLLDLASLAISIAVYLLNEFYLKGMTANPFIRGHLNDFLAIWIFIPYCNGLLSLYPYRRIKINTLPASVMVALVAGVGWEYLTPLYLETSVSDPVDLLMYVGAGVLYGLSWILVRRKRSGRVC